MNAVAVPENPVRAEQDRLEDSSVADDVADPEFEMFRYN